jgi:hypothetical protein
LATLTAYADLRDTITTTVKVAPTPSGSPETLAVVTILPGGVAWILTSVAGCEPAMAPAPPLEAEGHPKDETCNGGQPDCKACGGKLGFCVSPNAGCACKMPRCPTRKPSCAGQECAGSDGMSAGSTTLKLLTWPRRQMHFFESDRLRVRFPNIPKV